MSALRIDPVAAGDAAAVADLVAALEASLHGHSAFSQADLEREWSELGSDPDAWVVRDGGRIVGYALVRERGEPWRAEGYVHPGALGRGIGTLIATRLEAAAARGGAGRIQNAVIEADTAARELLESLGYDAVRVVREMRIELDVRPPAPQWPGGLQPVPFDPERDAPAFHAALEDAFADAWGHVPRGLEAWSNEQLLSERFDPTLWGVVCAGDEIAGGTICLGDTYGGGWIHALFTRRPWRRQGVGAALLQDAFVRFWEREERSIGLGVDAASSSGAFRLYERAGMAPELGWVAYEKALGPGRG